MVGNVARKGPKQGVEDQRKLSTTIRLSDCQKLWIKIYAWKQPPTVLKHGRRSTRW